VRSRSPRRSSARRPIAARVGAVARFKLEDRGRRKGRGRAQGMKRLDPRVIRALDSMDALAHFAKEYTRGTPIPDDMWDHATVISDYLHYPPPQRWLWQWLNDPERARS
jgi:hypothetical protein